MRMFMAGVGFGIGIAVGVTVGVAAIGGYMLVRKDIKKALRNLNKAKEPMKEVEQQ